MRRLIEATFVSLDLDATRLKARLVDELRRTLANNSAILTYVPGQRR